MNIPKFGKSKYKNIVTELDGIKFDSKKEAKRYTELRMLEKGNVISNLRLQVPFILLPKQKGLIRDEHPVKYTADFVYIENGQEVVEDAKGIRTKDYVIRRKLMLERFNISIKEV